MVTYKIVLENSLVNNQLYNPQHSYSLVQKKLHL